MVGWLIGWLVVWLVGRLVGLSVIISQKWFKLHFYAPIGLLVYWKDFVVMTLISGRQFFFWGGERNESCDKIPR